MKLPSDADLLYFYIQLFILKFVSNLYSELAVFRLRQRFVFWSWRSSLMVAVGL